MENGEGGNVGKKRFLIGMCNELKNQLLEITEEVQEAKLSEQRNHPPVWIRLLNGVLPLVLLRQQATHFLFPSVNTSQNISVTKYSVIMSSLQHRLRNVHFSPIAANVRPKNDMIGIAVSSSTKAIAFRARKLLVSQQLRLEIPIQLR